MSEKEIKYYIYKTTNLVNGKIYIGYHASDNIEKDSYLGSGHLLKRAVEKYGKENFKREILFEFDDMESARLKERELVNEDFIHDTNTYNISLGGFGGGLPGKLNPFWGKTHTDEIKKRFSEQRTGRRLTEEWKENISKGLIESEAFQNSFTEERNKKVSEGLKNSEAHKQAMSSQEVRDKISEGIRNSNFYEVVKSEEHSKKMSEILKNSEAHKNATQSEEFRKKQSELRLGKPCPWVVETNKNPEKIRKTAEKHRGSKRTEEQCKHISESIIGLNTGDKSSSFRGYYITPFGKFDSLKSASKSIGITELCIYDRCKIKNNITAKKCSQKSDPNLTDNMIGKTWKELGWSFEPAERKPGGRKNV